MAMEEQLHGYQTRLEQLRGYLDLDNKKQRLTALEAEMSSPTFWNDRQRGQALSREARLLRDSIDAWQGLRKQLDDLAELHALAVEEADQASLPELEEESERLGEGLDDLEFRTMLADPDDPKSAILVIHSGAGGTEAADWAQMLLRMYTRWAERSGFGCEVMDLTPGDEAGIKGVTLEITGEYAYGYLKAEAGVHRLVRISPFDSNSRRHTSFASVFVYPEVDEKIEVDLREEDLQIDTYRSGGAGGQHVNKTSSAVRITHVPTGIVVQCQNERSQYKNKSAALKVLAARLYQHLKDQEQKKLDQVESTKKSIDFGSQIRSYVLHPYNMVKDHRTDHETANVQAVMDGEIDGFIRAFLVQAQAQ
ncbi:MAG: peptide chain release factor 2 [Candidatus Latescibacterota bacterium]